ncbi:MAG: endonuclease/exonuclease/phosphatase family protein [Gemmatimonadaceae bacterium]
MTYNIQYGGGNLEATIAAIKAVDPDLVALQEVDVHWDARSQFVDQAAVLAERLRLHVRFAPIYRLPGADPSAPPREFGVALLSKYPVTSFSTHLLTRHSTQAENAPPAPAPGLLDATVDVLGARIRVLNAHFDYRSDPAVRSQQVRETLEVIGASTVPTLMFGDFNAAPAAPELQPLLARLQDSWPVSAGQGWTYPAVRPAERIDYVLASPHFRVVAARVPDTKASDHCPVVVDLVVVSSR